MSALEERRQRAREAFWDTSAGTMTGAAEGLDEAIETATRVQITDGIIRIYHEAWAANGCSRKAGLRAALVALGFGVTEE